jgi:hypothetical protein
VSARAFFLALMLAITGSHAAGGLGLPGPVAPSPPAQVQPVLEVLAPVVRPECGNALLAIALVPGVVNPVAPLPPEAQTLFGPVVVVCGSVPPGPAPQRCALDASVLLLLNTVSGAAAGSPLPVDTDVVAPAAEELIVIQDRLPPPVNAAGLAELAAGVLTCAPVPATPGPPASAPVDNPDEDGAALAPTDGNLGFFTSALAPSLDALKSGFGTNGSNGAPRATPATRRVAATNAYAYPLVFFLPLVLLVLGGYLGWAITRPVRLPE